MNTKKNILLLGSLSFDCFTVSAHNALQTSVFEIQYGNWNIDSVLHENDFITPEDTTILPSLEVGGALPITQNLDVSCPGLQITSVSWMNETACEALDGQLFFDIEDVNQEANWGIRSTSSTCNALYSAAISAVSSGYDTGAATGMVTYIPSVSSTQPFFEFIYQPPCNVNASTGTADAAICAGSSVTISAGATGGNSPYTYQWDNGLGSGASFTVSPPNKH